MKFIIYAGCSLEEIEMAIEADSYAEAEEYAASIASESFYNHSSYFESQIETDLCEYDMDEETPEYEAEFDNLLTDYEINDIYYEVRDFSYDREDHLEILALQEGEFHSI